MTDVKHVMFVAGVGLELHGPTVERMKENYSKRGVELNDARLRMAKLPQTAQVPPARRSSVPEPLLKTIYSITLK